MNNAEILKEAMKKMTKEECHAFYENTLLAETKGKDYIKAELKIKEIEIEIEKLRAIKQEKAHKYKMIELEKKKEIAELMKYKGKKKR